MRVLLVLLCLTACQPIEIENYNIFTGWENESQIIHKGTQQNNSLHDGN